MQTRIKEIEMRLSKLYGDVAAIKKKRRPMEMEDIGRSEDQSVAQHILVEGSPGIVLLFVANGQRARCYKIGISF